MVENAWKILGWLGIACFFTRFLVQWIASERARESVAPPVFWVMSVAGALLMMLYSIHRREPIFLIGYVVTLSVYLRNLWFHYRGSVGLGPISTSLLALLAGVLLVTQGIDDLRPGYGQSMTWLAIGVVGQGTWSSRFIVQWFFTERVGVSHFPEAFWWISLGGNALLLSYALHVGDPVWIAGLCAGPIVQIRNLMIMHRAAG